jgi:hypothetical protein
MVRSNDDIFAHVSLIILNLGEWKMEISRQNRTRNGCDPLLVRVDTWESLIYDLLF